MLNKKNSKTSFFLAGLSGIFLLGVGCNVRGLTSGYRKLSKQEKATVLLVDTTDPGQLDPQGTYRITSSEFHALLRQQPQSLIYKWVPWCTSAQCLSLNSYASYAKRHNLKLFVVADSYEPALFEINRLKGEPIFVIDHQRYGSNIRGTYSRRFVQDLTRIARLPDSVLYAQLFFFSRDSLVRTVEKSRTVVLP